MQNDEDDEDDELDDNDEWFKSLQMKFLKDDVFLLLDEFDDNDDVDDIIAIMSQINDQIEHNEHNENLEHFISLCLNDNDRSWRNSLIFVYQKLKDYVKW